jgi:hypothetical protein
MVLPTSRDAHFRSRSAIRTTPRSDGEANRTIRPPRFRRFPPWEMAARPQVRLGVASRDSPRPSTAFAVPAFTGPSGRTRPLPRAHSEGHERLPARARGRPSPGAGTAWRAHASALGLQPAAAAPAPHESAASIRCTTTRTARPIPLSFECPRADRVRSARPLRASEHTNAIVGSHERGTLGWPKRGTRPGGFGGAQRITIGSARPAPATPLQARVIVEPLPGPARFMC